MIWRLVLLAALCLAVSRADAQVGLSAGIGFLKPFTTSAVCKTITAVSGTIAAVSGTIAAPC